AGHAHVLLGMRHRGGSKPFLRGEVAEAALYDRALSREEVAAAFRSSGWHAYVERALAALTPEQRRQHDEPRQQAQRLRAENEGLPPLPVSYSGTRFQPAPTHRLKRGDVKAPEEVVTPGGLSAIAVPDPDLGLPADAPEAERRLRFGTW